MEANLDFMWYVFSFGRAALVVAVAYGAFQLVKYVTAKTKNEVWKGITTRFGASILDAVAMIDQTMKKELKKAKREDSPGGTSFTPNERQDMLNAVYDVLKAEYGGIQGIFKIFKKIGIPKEIDIKKKVDTMIEAAVNIHELRKR